MVEIGDKYGKLTVVGITNKRISCSDGVRNMKYAVCVDDCGKKTVCSVESLMTQASAHGVKIEPTVTVRRITDWMTVKQAALATMNMKAKTEPTTDWKRKILLADHSPIRCLQFWIEFKNIPYSTSVHFARHFTGVTHFVGTQRTDRCEGIDRSLLPQGIPVNHSMIINAAEIMFISKRRLCNLASEETRNVWKQVVSKLHEIGEVELADLCRPMCWWHHNRCPEMKPCGMCCSMYDELTNEGLWS